MGAPKQKWTAEEEAALKAGIARYGLGKWSAILKDSEFSGVLRSRSNVDLKDKWRNINVMANGWGARQRGKSLSRSTPLPPKPDRKCMVLSTVVEKVPEILDVTRHLAVSTKTLPMVISKKPIFRLDDVVLEAVINLKEPYRSTRDAISSYIEERYLAPPSFKKILAANLKLMVETGRLIKVKNQYRIPPSSVSLTEREDMAPLLKGLQKGSLNAEKKGNKVFTKGQVDTELEKIKGMTAQEAAAAAAKAVAEAEAAIAEAEAAALEAEKAEAEAEAAQCFAEAAMTVLNSRTVHAW